MAEAGALAQAALDAGDADPRLFILAAHAEAAAGRVEAAVLRLEQGLALSPADIGLLTALGLHLSALDRRADAAQAFETVLRLAPDTPAACFGLGALFAGESRLDEAWPHLERAVALAPAWAGALTLGAEVAVRRGDFARARDWLARLGPAAARDPFAALILARVEAQEGATAGALARLEDLLARASEPAFRSDVLTALGDLHDGGGRAAEAWRAYAERNALLRELWRPAWAGPAAELAARVDRLGRWRANGPARVAADAPPPAAGHVFLLGFPRSATTLLEQILAGHPQVVALEEAPTLLEAETAFFVPPDGLERLGTLDAAGAAEFRAAYWARVRAGGVDPDGKVFVDKMPINTIVLPLIEALFPDARVLFALRDPRDVVLSGFRRAFVPNAVNFHLLDPVDSARFYGRVMGLAQACRSDSPLRFHEIRYEALVSDLEGETRRLCAALDLAFDSAMLDFARTAQARRVRTPSATQVRSGLFRGDGQWRAYACELAPAFAALAPWIERLGYDPSESDDAAPANPS